MYRPKSCACVWSMFIAWLWTLMSAMCWFVMLLVVWCLASMWLTTCPWRAASSEMKTLCARVMP